MRKKILIKVLLLGIAVVTIVSNPAHAVEVANENTDANITIEEGVTVIPNEDEVPDGNEGGSSNAALKLFLWPSDFRFSDAKSSSFEQTVSVANNLTRYLAVADQRGTFSGYEVTARMDGFKDLTNPTSELKGVKLNIAQSVVNFPDPTKPNTVPPVQELDNNIIADDLVVLDKTSSVRILKAPENKGQGYFGVKINGDDIKLVIPGNQGKVNTDYKSTITWSLNDAPGF